MRVIVVVVLVAAVVASLSWYNGSAASRSLLDFASSAYGYAVNNQVEISVEISNVLPQGRVYDIPQDQQPLTVTMRVRNLSLLPSRGLSLALRFSEAVVDCLELNSAHGIVVNVGALPPASERESFEVYFIPQFNGDPLATQKVVELLESPIMVQAVVQSKVEHLLVIPTVSLALPAASQTAAVTIDNLGDLSLISQPGKLRLVVSNSNTGVETLLAGVTGFFPARGGVIVIEEDGNVVTYDLKGNSITLLDRATPTPLQFNASREMFGAVIVDNGTQAIVVYDLHTTQSYILARAPHPYVLGWVGYRVLVSVDNPQGLELELRGLDGSRELLGVGVLPTPLATPVWDNERRFLAYAAAGNTVVVVDVIKATSQVIRYACDPAWTPLGLQVTYESVGRVIRFK